MEGLLLRHLSSLLCYSFQQPVKNHATGSAILLMAVKDWRTAWNMPEATSPARAKIGAQANLKAAEHKSTRKILKP